MIKTVIKIILTQKGKTLLGLSGIFLAALGFHTILSLSMGFKQEINSYYRELEGLYVMKKGAIDPVFSALPRDLEKPLQKIEGVGALSPEIWSLVSTLDGEKPMSRGLFAFISLGGIDPKKLAMLKEGGIYLKTLEEGSPLEKDDLAGALISRSIAEKYGKSIGDSIAVDENAFTVRGIYRTGSFFLDSAVLIHQEKAYEISGKSRKYVSVFYIHTSPEETGSLARRISTAFPRLGVRSNASLGEDFSGIIRTVDIFAFFLSAFTVLFTLVIIINFMASSIRERKRDFGIILCEGWQMKDLVRLVITESTLMAFTGSLAGAGISLLMLSAFKPLLPFTPYFSIHLPLLCILAGTAAGAAGGLISVIRLGKIDPAEILRNL